MRGMGASLAKDIPPPDKLSKLPAGDDPDEPGDDEAGEDEAAELAAMEAFESAKGPAEKLAAFKDLMATCKY